MSNEDVEACAAADLDAGFISEDFWDNAVILDLNPTQKITLNVPVRVLEHFQQAGKSY
jgi:hypothetical protein